MPARAQTRPLDDLPDDERQDRDVALFLDM
jgi:hypothetical protein